MTTNLSREIWRGCLGTYDKYNFLQFIKVSTNVDADKLVQYYQSYTSRFAKSKGKLETVKHLKSLYSVALRYSAKVTFDPLPFIRTDKQGLPRVLKPFKVLLNGSPDDKRAALSILQLYKLIEVKGETRLDSIVEPYTGTPNPDWIETFKEVVLEEFPPSEISERVSKLRGSLFISGKNGPNGPAMTTSHIDYVAIHGSDIADAVQMLAGLTSNDQLLSMIGEVRCAIDYGVKHPKKSPAHSRLRIKYEPGGKARIFAILDLFSQSALKPIHEFLMNWLKSQETDGTNEHSLAAKQIGQWTKTDKPLWSFDLTTATDRYPVFLQNIVIKACFGEEIADCWNRIITNRDFLTPDSSKSVRFAVGQPLGALSSWATFAVTHHLHIRTAARLSGYDRSFKDYRIIGDDVAIYQNAAVASRYIGMMKDLAVPFSTDKSIMPHQCKGVNAGELAKRVFVNGNELTPVPPDAVIVYMRLPLGKRILIETSIDRGYTRFENPYTVQSIIFKQDEWAALTFPVGRTLAPFKGVKVVLSGWDDLTEPPPGGLNPGWAYWETAYYAIPEYGFRWILKSFLNKEIISAISSGNRIREALYNATWDGSLEKYQGGDWKPGLCDCNQAMSLVITYMSQGFGEAMAEINDWVEFETLDLYRIIAKMHSFLKPEDLFRTQNFDDEKKKTRVFVSRVVRDAQNIAKKGLDSFLQYTNN